MAATTHPGPDPCPSWCRRRHVAADHPDDRHHQGRGHLVAVVAGRPTLDPDERTNPVSVVVRLVRRVDSPVTWLEVLSEEGSQVRMVLTVESARRLVAVAGALLDRARS